MNDAMQLVAKGWYRLYWAVSLLVSIAFVAGFVLTETAPDFAHYGELFALSATGAVLAGIHIFYSITAYWIIRRNSQPLALIVSAMLLTLLLLYGLNATTPGNGAWLYVGAWLGTLLFAGVYGLPAALGSVLVGLIYALMQSDFELARIGLPAITLLAGSAVIAPLSYLFWQRRFINQQELRLKSLSDTLRSKQELSVILIQSLADGVIVTDPEGKISLINPAAAQLTGWTVEDARGVDAKLVAKLTNENGEELKNDENPFSLVLAQKKQHITQTFQMADRSENKRVVSMAISPVKADGATVAGVVAVMRDVSQEHAAEQQRAEFISTASHEMRTPVAAIEGYLALALNEKVSTVDARARGYLEKAHSSTQHLGKLFQDLLTSAKAEDGRLSSHPVVVEMGAFIEQLVEDLRFSAQKKGLAAEFVVGESQTIDATAGADTGLKVVKPLYYVHADPERLREVLTNLFDNAIKYTDQGKITVGLTGNTEVVQTYVRDTGPGIPPADIQHLFQKFYRVDNSATRVIGGTGLGLFISRKIIELYNGRIWAESELGKGSAFYINLPRLNTQRAEQLKAAEATQSGSAPAKQT